MLKLYTNTGWMRGLLLVAGFYNLLYGIGMFVFHLHPFNLASLGLPEHPMVWQIISVMVVVYGIGYLIASRNPFRHWLVVMIGLIFNVLIACVLAYFIVIGRIPQSAWIVIFSNNLVWVAPFALILFGAFEQNRKFSEQINYFYSSRTDVSRLPILTNKGASLLLLSHTSPVLLVFLRHFGCTFCREALQSLARDRKTIEALGTKIVLVHMSDDVKAEEMTSRYGLNELHRISDPDKILYNAFALERGDFRQLLGLKVLLRGFIAGVLGGNSIGAIQGDHTQLPGVFLIYKNEVVKSYRHDTAADTPDYILLANCESC